MRPRERREGGEQDLFRSRLDQIIDMNHALVKLARTIAWFGAPPMSYRKRRIASLVIIAMAPPKTATKSKSPCANARPKPRPASRERAISSCKPGAISTLFAN